MTLALENGRRLPLRSPRETVPEGVSYTDYADPNVLVGCADEHGQYRALTWNERFTYYWVIMRSAMMGYAEDTATEGECSLCFDTKPLRRFHDGGSKCDRAACGECLAVYSFRERAKSEGRAPTCPYCRGVYLEVENGCS